MKNTLLIFLLLPIFSSAQVVAFEVQYKAEHGEYAAKLSTFNQIITMVEGMTCDDFFLTTDNGKITNTKTCTWNYTPTNYKKSYGWIYFNKIVDSDTIVFHKKRLRIELMHFESVFPPFQPDDCGVYHLTKEQLLKSRVYMMSLHKFYDKPIMITNAEIQVIRGGRGIINKKIKKPMQDIYMKYIDQLYKLRAGDEVFIKNIKYQYPSLNDDSVEFDAEVIQVIIQ